ncbi:nitroreductase family protein [Carnobacterium gallinarum]|uniref:nitroreductase family protein n=1 Tax=Carnobacterium gallinarum TaxID=2749 RepID=UPI0005553A5C|nr:nitroreductase family protein [Carnobacterium gallinarum]
MTTTSYKNNNFEDILKGRRSLRNYDPTVKISKEEMTEILADSVTAPSSVNMQPWRFVVVESEESKATLKPLIRFNTLQNDSSSAMILIFGDMNSFDYSEAIYGTAVEKGLMPAEIKEQQLAALTPYYDGMSKTQKQEVALIDGSLAAMQLMLVARAYGYDTNPIGGFEKDKLAEAFDLDPERYIPVMIVSIGKAVDAGYESVRLPISEITTWK